MRLCASSSQINNCDPRVTVTQRTKLVLVVGGIRRPCSYPTEIVPNILKELQQIRGSWASVKARNKTQEMFKKSMECIDDTDADEKDV